MRTGSPLVLVPFLQNIGLEVDIEGVFAKIKLKALHSLYGGRKGNGRTGLLAKIAMKDQCVLMSCLHPKIATTTVEWTFYVIVTPHSIPSIEQLYSADAVRLIPLGGKDRPSS